ncbi:universal stress protein [Nannocystis pusilla]|uniref:Universal stress protein n=1 Tax=Nannocystis pusilla TaxID=889268 RepID=A0ABS7U560_9BACT|nr:universal stress protein [Nannocystis pusilla]MBZ5715692.1 universal stress protein [Nannocystis pusilla]
MRPSKILLATDLSCRCDRALDRAAGLAGEWGARLVVVHALQRPAPVVDVPSWRRPVDPRRAALRRVRDDMREIVDLELEVVVEPGEPASLILDTAERLGCGLIVTGVARDETLGRALLGTTVEKIARQAQVPLLVVKSRPRGPYASVVVASDFSDASRAALEQVLELLPTAQVSLFHAYNVPFEGLVNDRMAAREASAREAAAMSQAFLDATPAVARSGRPVAQICEYGVIEEVLTDLAEMGRVDLVALGTKGRSGIVGALLGSVSGRLLGSLTLDILVVRRSAG